MKNKALILSNTKVDQKLERMAYQVLEHNFDENEIIVIGIAKRGYVIAEKMVTILNKISPIKTVLVALTLPSNLITEEATLSEELSSFDGKSILVVDDVLNSGKSLIYAVKHLLNANVKKMHTAVLVNRRHRKYPIRADFSGLTLSTTLQEHISVEFNGAETSVYLE